MLNKEKVTWEGTVVPKGPWYEKTLFSIGEYEVTTGKLLIGGGTIAGIVIGIVVCICLACGWWKRKQLAKLMTRDIGDKLKDAVLKMKE